jgi:hypothetical protein
MSKIYGRSGSTAMWSGGWLLEADWDSQQGPGTLIECRRVKRQTLREFREIQGSYEAEAEYFCII